MTHTKEHHSREPWEVEIDDNSTSPHIRSCPDGSLIVWKLSGYTPEVAIANAKRIVACVNYCAGMTDEELQEGRKG